MWERLQAWLEPASGDRLTGHHFEFGLPGPVAFGFILVAFAAAAGTLWCWPRLSRLPPFARATISTLRGFSLALALFMLLDPCIVAERVRSGDRRVALLFDNSRSMRIQDAEGRSRGERMKEAWKAADETCRRRLESKYRLSLGGFGETLAPIQKVDDLDFSGPQSDILGAIGTATKELEGVNVAAVVVLSDGAQRGGHGPTLPADFAPGAPVFTIGVGEDADWRDLEVERLTVSRAKFDQSPVTIVAPLRASGIESGEATIEVVAGGRVVAQTTLKLDGAETEREVRLEFTPDEKDWLDCEVRARLVKGGPDRAPQNNSRRFVVDNRGRTHRILYFAARPNWENKFLRRALEDDPELKLTSLLAISKPDRKFVFRGKKSSGATNPLFEGFEGGRGDDVRYDEAVFLRLGVQGSELEKGYPNLPEALYPYQLVIWGDVDFSFFSQEQLELTREFVRKRGGSMLFLGGPHSFTEGKYDATPIEGMLPVLLRSRGEESDEARKAISARFKVGPTLEGQAAGAWSLDKDPEKSRSLWRDTPPIAGLNLFPMVRPGATVLARVDDPKSPQNGSPIFVWERFGEGRTAALAAGATWPWRMDASVATDDHRHERLWRQTLRSLVEGVAEPAYWRGKADFYAAGAKANMEFVVRDDLYNEREGLRVQGKDRAPSGAETPLAVEESIREPGLYAAESAPAEPGLHRVTIDADDESGKRVAHLEEAYLADEDQGEFENARFDPSFLKRLAERTGGRYLPLSQLDRLADLIPWKKLSESSQVRVRLWKFPGFFVALVAALAAEWWMRRKRGFA